MENEKIGGGHYECSRCGRTIFGSKPCACLKQEIGGSEDRPVDKDFEDWYFGEGDIVNGMEDPYDIAETAWDAREDKLKRYIEARKKTIQASIDAEILSGNKVKEQCERTALAEITALEKAIVKGELRLGDDSIYLFQQYMKETGSKGKAAYCNMCDDGKYIKWFEKKLNNLFKLQMESYIESKSFIDLCTKLQERLMFDDAVVHDEIIVDWERALKKIQDEIKNESD